MIASEGRSPRGQLAFDATTLASRTSFVGRERELADVERLVRERRLVTVVGPAGCGKTRLALQLARQLCNQYPDGIGVVDLSTTARDTDCGPTVAQALGVRTSPGREDLDAIVETLRRAEALLIFDNCEHVGDSCGALLHAVTVQCDGVTVLATSREPLGLETEERYLLEPLAVPTSDNPLIVLNSEAGAFFVDRLRTVVPDFEPTEQDASVIRQICAQLDGLPLALELAAARFRALSLSTISEELAHRFSLLADDRRGRPERSRSLETSLAWSWDLLTEDERIVLRRISVFAGGFIAPAAQRVVAERPSFRVAPALASLVDKSLVTFDSTTDRYSLLESTRLFAARQLESLPESTQVRGRHLEWVRGWLHARASALESRRTREVLAEIDVESANVRRALEWASESEDAEAILDILASTGWWWILRGHAHEATSWIRSAKEASTNSKSECSNSARWFEILLLSHHISDVEDLTRRCEVLRGTANGSGDRWHEGRALGQMAMLGLYLTADPEEARRSLVKARKVTYGAGDAFFTAYIDLGIVADLHNRDSHDLALTRLDDLEYNVRRIGTPLVTGLYFGRRAISEARCGSFTDAESSVVAARDAAGDLARANVNFFAAAATIEMQLHRCEFAHLCEVLPQMAREMIRDGELLFLPLVSRYLAYAMVGSGDAKAARAALSVVCAVPDVERAYPYRIWLRDALALATSTLGDLDAAARMLELQLADAGAVGNRYMAARAKLQLSAIERERARVDTAAELGVDALTTMIELGYVPDIAEAVEELAGLASTRRQYAIAARMFGGVDALRATTAIGCRVGRQRVLADDRRDAEARLGSAKYEREHALGSTLAMRDLASYAMRTAGQASLRVSRTSDSLSDAEKTVAELATSGLSNRAIAAKLLIGSETVKTHLSHAYRKLGVSNRTALAARLNEFVAKSRETADD
jgi:predicted ATPase/DNA-binding CsgD family transcriptional regulator